jgi:hypothetical protein
VEVQQSQGGDTPTASVNNNKFGDRLQLAIWADLQLLGVGWSNIHAIAWIKITCSQCQIMDLDLDLKIQCYMDRSMKLQKKSQNAAHSGAIMHSGNEWLEPTRSQPEMERSRRWIAAGEGL